MDLPLRTVVALLVATLLAIVGLAATASQGGAATIAGRQYVVATYDGSTLRLFVSGREVGHKTIRRPVPSTTAAVEIGSFLGGGVWNGTLDDVAIYRRALPAATIAGHYRIGTSRGATYARTVERDPSVVAYWRLDDRRATRAVDSVGAHSGTYRANSGVGASGLLTGDPDEALDLNGAQGGVLIPNSPALQLKSFTLEAWTTAREFGNSHILAKVGAWFLKLNPSGNWSTGIFNNGKILGVFSRQKAVLANTPAVAPPVPAAPAAPGLPAAKPPGGSGSNTGLVVTVAIAAIAIAAWLVVRSRRERDDVDEDAVDDEPEERPARPGTAAVAEKKPAGTPGRRPPRPPSGGLSRAPGQSAAPGQRTPEARPGRASSRRDDDAT